MCDLTFLTLIVLLLLNYKKLDYSMAFLSVYVIIQAMHLCNCFKHALILCGGYSIYLGCKKIYNYINMF